ncbi:MAG TPA: TIGR04282 family arsenosugar biosynthesis glycosyltransferase [Candidatus Sulfotelmatobacter sp.]|nr:TIGR04282 family arsenosugar biosynthesis glycosyltransferase [Candidatus Sulfotelmatobacter sp.]
MLAIFAKVPEPGSVKTRLIPELGPDRAAELAEAFLEDTVTRMRKLEWAECIVAATARFQRSYLKADELWLQSEGDLGERLEKVLRLALKRRKTVLAIGSDTPNLPLEYLENARRGLDTADAVLGPSLDGGFYLIGLNDCPIGLLEGIQWSHSSTLAAAMAKLDQFGMKTVVINPWFDVDSHEDLDRLRRQLAADPTSAPVTANYLRHTLPG